MVEHIEAFRPILGRDRSAVVVVDDVVLDQSVVAAVDRDAPFESRLDGAAIHSIPEHGELVAVRRGGLWTKQVMRVDRVAADVVGGAVEGQIRRAPQILELGVTEIHVGHVVVQRVPACAGWIFRADNDVPRQVAHVR